MSMKKFCTHLLPAPEKEFPSHDTEYCKSFAGRLAVARSVRNADSAIELVGVIRIANLSCRKLAKENGSPFFYQGDTAREHAQRGRPTASGRGRPDARLQSRFDSRRILE